MSRKLPNWLMNLDDEDVLTDSESTDREPRKPLQTKTNLAESNKTDAELSDSDHIPSTELTNSKENQNESNSKQSTENPPARQRTRYSLRISRIGSVPEETETDTPPTSSLPFIDYKGRVEYYTEMYDIAIACDSLTKWVVDQQQDVVPIAFDMEWPFTFQTGAGKSAVIQLCADTDLCYVFHVSRLKKLPAALVRLLQHPKVRLHGVNIKNDFRKLGRDFKEVNSQVMIDQCRDLGVWCNEVINSSGRWSMARLVLYICKLQINKDRKVRMSKWHIQPLTKEQQLYAAIDVYTPTGLTEAVLAQMLVSSHADYFLALSSTIYHQLQISQVIYYDLEKREKERDEKNKEFDEKYGEETQ